MIYQALIWLITGHKLPPLLIPAASFDEALKAARLINPNYDTGQVSELTNNF